MEFILLNHLKLMWHSIPNVERRKAFFKNCLHLNNYFLTFLFSFFIFITIFSSVVFEKQRRVL